MTRAGERTGRAGEDIARRHLEAKGYRIVARRYRTRTGELDIVASLGGILVFAEVKVRRRACYGSPAEAVGTSKQERLARAAAQFLAEHPDGRAASDAFCRFDVIAITWPLGGEPKVDHIEDAFRPAP